MDMLSSAEDRARKIKVLLFDVDGVLTDGSISLGGRGASSDIELKTFHVHDGLGIALARSVGIRCGFITKRNSEAAKRRAEELKVDFFYMGVASKIKVVIEIMEISSATMEEIAYLGDDVIDLPVMRKCGFAMAVADANDAVRDAAHWITPRNGGRGAGRDAVEFILKSQNLLQTAIGLYLDHDGKLASKTSQ